MDKNFQKNFYLVLVTNHCEMSEPYFRAIQDYLPAAEWRRRWQEGMERVPEYRIIEHEGVRRIADHKETTGPGRHSRNSYIYCGYIAGPLIFPGEEVDPESDSELAQVIREGLEEFRNEEATGHNFLSYSLDVPAARLKMDKAYDMVRHAVTSCRYPNGTAANPAPGMTPAMSPKSA